MPNENECKFEIKIGQNTIHTYYFDVNKNGEPTKLGDGTYSVVYKIRSEDKREFAVKLLYSHRTYSKIEINTTESTQQSSEESSKNITQDINTTKSTPLSRFEFEMHCAENIRQILEDLDHDQRFDDHLVGIIGGTSKFRSSGAYKYLENFFQTHCIDVSDFALVMPLFDTTLKDILEGSVIRERRYRLAGNSLKNITKDEQKILESKIFCSPNELKEKAAGLNLKVDDSDISTISGYDIFKAVNYKRRISIMLPFLSDISKGLKVLHLAGLCHYDLKPANIFVKILNKAEISAAIGDLGFINVKNELSISVINIQDDLPLGTRHYRSPEQKDYFDICELNITHEKGADEKGVDEKGADEKGVDEKGADEDIYLSLTVEDPKFFESIIEKDDYVVFSKDPRRTRYPISDIIKSKDGVKIIVKGDNITEKISVDRNTQVVFYKKQGIRTDLFGFGAILYDMLTCGKSPEHFYDNIRSYDSEEKDIKTIMSLYSQICSYQLAEPGLVNIFSPFRNERTFEYVDPTIIEIMLKCMLYKAKGTYYDIGNGKWEATELLRCDIQKLYKGDNDRGDNAKYPIQKERENSSLINTPETLDSTMHFSGFRHNMTAMIENLHKQSYLATRLIEGICCFEKLVNLVAETKYSEKFYFAEMLPDNITQSDTNQLEFEYYAYKKDDLELYKSDLRDDQFYVKITRSISNPFVPNQITFVRRKMRLYINGDDSFLYHFDDSSFFGDYVENGDWIVINRQLLKIKKDDDSNWECNRKFENDGFIIKKSKTNHPNNIISLVDEEGKTPKITDVPEEVVYYKNLDLEDYYIYMLGTYLYQIFLVGTTNAAKSKPCLVSILESILYTDDAIKFEITEIKKINIYDEIPINDCIKHLFEYITYTYIKLLFCSHKKQCLKALEPNLNQAIFYSLGHCQEVIAKILNIARASLTRTPQITQAKIDEIENLKGQIPNFDTLLNSILKVSSPFKKPLIIDDVAKFKSQLEGARNENANLKEKYKTEIEKLEHKNAELTKDSSDKDAACKKNNEEILQLKKEISRLNEIKSPKKSWISIEKK
ncbi:MAG: hypothetical protein HQK65_00980 [Desulfamplus sp.]|nr:hypothetical protein [Desulfamplus sp.]